MNCTLIHDFLLTLREEFYSIYCMSEGEGGFKPTPADNKSINRREFLTGMLKLGVGAVVGAVGATGSREVRRIAGQQSAPTEVPLLTTEPISPTEVEVTPLENIKPEKVVMTEVDSTKSNPIGAKFQILRAPQVSWEDINKIQMLPFGQIGSSAVTVSDELIKLGLKGMSLTQEQTDTINRAFGDAELKALQIISSILYPKNSTSNNPEPQA